MRRGLIHVTAKSEVRLYGDGGVEASTIPPAYGIAILSTVESSQAAPADKPQPGGHPGSESIDLGLLQHVSDRQRLQPQLICDADSCR